MDDGAPTGTAATLLAATLRELDERGSAGVSLRAVARRAGVSHAAPKYFFGDRAGLMAAAATVGFMDLAQRVRAAVAEGSTPLADAGRAYVSFAMERPALFDLMFRPSELDNTDAALRAARDDALGALNEILDPAAAARGVVSDTTLSNWALAHGIAVLARDGALAQVGSSGSLDPSLPLRLIEHSAVPSRAR